MKSKTKKKTIIKILLSVFIFMNATNLYCCTCINELSVQESIKSNNYIFIGSVQDINKVKIENLDLNKVIFNVESFFKGKKMNNQMIIYTNYEEDMCGVLFEINKKYIVYADVYGKKYETKSKLLKKILETDICTRTTLYYEQEYLSLKGNKKEKPMRKKKCGNNKAIFIKN